MKWYWWGIAGYLIFGFLVAIVSIGNCWKDWRNGTAVDSEIRNCSPKKLVWYSLKLLLKYTLLWGILFFVQGIVTLLEELGIAVNPLETISNESAGGGIPAFLIEDVREILVKKLRKFKK